MWNKYTFGFNMPALVKILLLTFSLVQLAYAGEDVSYSALTLDQATKKIIEQNKNKVMGAKTEIIGGKEVHVIKVLTSDGRVQSLIVDVETGRLIK